MSTGTKSLSQSLTCRQVINQNIRTFLLINANSPTSANLKIQVYIKCCWCSSVTTAAQGLRLQRLWLKNNNTSVCLLKFYLCYYIRTICSVILRFIVILMSTGTKSPSPADKTLTTISERSLLVNPFPQYQRNLEYRSI